MIKFPFPYLTTGTIVHGFGRGSKELNCPTANLDASSIENLPVEIDEASVGTNPFYKCKVKTLEAHLMHNFETDFYGEKLKIVLLGEIRKMTSFKDANELAMAIQNDIVKAHHELDSDQSREYLNHPYFKN
ncbi:unnamed protein product [Rotaria magnacalcarata]